MKSRYQKSQLVTKVYLGCHLGDQYYRENNLIKLNRLLCRSLNNRHSVYIFEILDNLNLDEFTTQLHELKSQNVLYARMVFGHKILLCLFTDRGQDYATSIVDTNSIDYNLIFTANLSALSTDLEQAAFQIYQLGLHVPESFGYKNRRFASSNLENNDKQFKLAFKKIGFIEQELKKAS